MELRSDEKGYMSNAAAKMADQFLDRGYLMRPLGPVLYTLPPFCTSSDDLHRLYDVFEELLG